MKKILFALLLLLLPQTANAEITLDLKRGVVEPMPIAISTFHATSPQHRDFATQIPGVISANLESSGLFKPLNPRAFVQDVNSMQIAGPRFGEWRAIGTQALVSGSVTTTADGRARVEFRLWDVFSEKQLIGMAYMTTPENWRRIAHIISDEIY
ncbi:MAG: Tol-Pal system protein TolB, partial [Alphaproteobacteria bacterium]|nr:Tol-Pal system protein TolB [Alphaproteobacteria bacterium]